MKLLHTCYCHASVFTESFYEISDEDIAEFRANYEMTPEQRADFSPENWIQELIDGDWAQLLDTKDTIMESEDQEDDKYFILEEETSTEWKPLSHWDNHPGYPTEDWTDEVIEGNTRQGYIDWVNSQLEQAEDDL